MLLLISIKNRELLEGPAPKVRVHGLPVTLRMLRVKTDNMIGFRIRNKFFAHAPKIGPSQRSRFFLLSKRSAASGGQE